MKRLVPSLVLLAIIGCSEQGLNPRAETQFSISDGAHTSGVGAQCVEGSPTWPQCQDFFFLPPIVPSPTLTDVSDGTRQPQVIISTLGFNSSGEPDDSPLTCVVGSVVETFQSSDISVNLDGTYKVGWNTSEYGLTEGTGYRICVGVEDSGSLAYLGYRDVMPVEGGAEVPRDTDQLPIYQFRNGGNIPIKFHINEHLYCTLGDNYDCTVATLGADAETALCDDGTCGLSVQQGTLSGDYRFLVELVTCQVEDGRITHLGVETDVPLIPACLEVTALDADFPGFSETNPAIAGACIDEGALAGYEEHHHLLQMFHARSSDGKVEALPNMNFPGALTCEGFEEPGAGMALSSNPLVRFAQNGLRRVKGLVAPLVTPSTLNAADRGFGGGLSLEASPIVWGLPVQMERGHLDGSETFVPADPNDTGWDDPEIGEPGSELRPAVRVWNGGDPTCDPGTLTNPAGEHCTPRLPVAGATVAFSLTAGDGSLDLGSGTVVEYGREKMFSDANGIASPVLTLGSANPHTVAARAVGIGCFEFDDDGDSAADCSIVAGNPPIPPSTDGTGVFGDNNPQFADRVVVELATGLIEFEARVCAAGPDISDDAFDGYSTTRSRGFSAKLSGGAVPATVYWTNDCDNLYVALVVETTDSDDNVSARLVFDNDNSGTPAVDDDILFLEKVVDKKTKTASWVFEDRFLSSDCLNSTQSDCGELDVDFGGTSDGDAKFYTDGTYGVYEFQHPLKSDDAGHDFQLEFDDYAGFFVVLQLGNGSKGNSEWPDFRQYQSIQVTAGGGN
ncbi:MAG: hypothetical protein GTO46_14910 [Gemmatimonadetes bacterium]|nr:hypothetical protein [Gemmatimonadota bacterium]NIO32846.1 hypothetical protein [Gemmatimonadota bacterium]